jgi:probable phosphoglycerate mutase
MAAPATQDWPSTLWLMRHGESAGNVARDAAESAGLHTIDITGRDVDVPLSALGERQARALGAWFSRQAEACQPDIVLTSPYLRAIQTADLLIDSASWKQRPPTRIVDERLREKEFGSLNRLTKAGIVQQFPAEWELRTRIGKFYYRPPGGESWCDVILRLRSVLDQIQLQYSRERVLIVAHQVVVLCFRYLLEALNEAEILEIDRHEDVANCSLTTYDFAFDPNGRAGMALRTYNFVTPLEEAGTAVTSAADPAVAPR